MYKKVFVLQTELWIPPFKWNMSQPSPIIVAREIKQIRWLILFDTPCIADCLSGVGNIINDSPVSGPGAGRQCDLITE